MASDGPKNDWGLINFKNSGWSFAISWTSKGNRETRERLSQAFPDEAMKQHQFSSTNNIKGNVIDACC